jgi:hypothetical protein
MIAPALFGKFNSNLGAITMKKAAPQPNELEAVVIIFGVPHRGRYAMALRFKLQDVEVARWTARQLSLACVVSTLPAAAELAKELRSWEFAGDGMPKLSNITAIQWERLRSLTVMMQDVDEPLKPITEPDDVAIEARRALRQQVWNGICVGEKVLAAQIDKAGDDWGSWPAIVLTITDGVYTLYWVDEPELGLIKRPLSELSPKFDQ